MSALFITIAASLLIGVGFLVAFLWAVKSGQFDDPYTPSVRILIDKGVKDRVETDSAETVSTGEKNGR